MKKGLIIFGIALLLIFLFWEGQRSALKSLAKSAASAADSENGKISTAENKVGAAAGQAPSQAAPSLTTEPRAAVVASAEPAQQMQARQRVPRNAVANRPEQLRPDPGVLRDNELFQSTLWKVWTGVRAVPASDFTDGADEVVGRYGGYYIVRDSHMNGDDTNFDSKNPMVVFDQRMNTVGVVPGIVMLTLKDNSTLAKIQREYGLKVTDRFEHLRLFFVTASISSFDLYKFVNVLKRDPRIEKAELEIVSRDYVKN
jgi:hypothetical protein